MTPEKIYKRNRRISKALKFLAPICFWGFLALSVLCLILTIRHSFGNMAEIVNALDSKQHTGEELQANYQMLIQKYGEWAIGNGGYGFQITFINIGNALFNKLMFLNFTFFVIFLASAFILGKWFLPKLSAQILINNQDMVNLVVLKNAEQNAESKDKK